jgi:hypothetical protein
MFNRNKGRSRQIWGLAGLVLLMGCSTAEQVASSPVVLQRTVKGDLAQVASCISSNISSSRYKLKWGIRRTDQVGEIDLAAMRVDSFVYGHNTVEWTVGLHDQGSSQISVTVRSARQLGTDLVPNELWPEFVQPCALK